MKNSDNKDLDQPKKILLKDYLAPAFAIESYYLDFNLGEETTRVLSRAQFIKTGHERNLCLEGEDLKLLSLTLNGSTPRYELNKNGLILFDVPEKFVLQIETELKPQENSSLEGLYKSNGIFCTQCEAQGFRKITYFMDRPDVMTSYTVRIEADEKKYPVLLSNGDLISQKSLDQGRHEVLWQDPFKKPCYLFALVAGDLGLIQDSFTTASGKKVQLQIYAAHGKQDSCQHAMSSLKKSMKWDEERFGREYDLSTYMIVAIDDFNAGAMENKGLNVFNSRLVFADPKTATDLDYFNIESVIAHEYFHNWTGNRVTLRDWFHLSLKEGLTVFRDQEFSMDQSSRSLIRIDNVADLRSFQFAEDAGPNAHPIRPASCLAVDNFFTSTIYEKGAEVIRMMQTMVGRPGFRKGMDLYFERHDGQAVIIEDFAKAIAEPNHQNWDQFKLWYSQAGTPQVQVQENYNSETRQYTLTLKQECDLSSQEKQEAIQKKPFHIPLVIGLLDAQSGKELPLVSTDAVVNSEGQTLVHLKNQSDTFVFKNILSKPVLSLNRQFSAPIHLNWKASFEELLFLMKQDSDSFNRWEAAQKIYQRAFSKLVKEYQASGKTSPDAKIALAFAGIVQDPTLDPDLKAKLMDIPDLDYLAQFEEIIDAPAFLKARRALAESFALAAETDLLQIYREFHGKNMTSLDPKDFGKRRLKNKCLGYLALLSSYHDLVMQQFKMAQIMTDQQAAFSVLVNLDSPLREEAIQLFYQQWKGESLVLNKWFAMQSSSIHDKTFENVQTLLQHPDFNLKNPNRVYSLLSGFGDNIPQFHRTDLDCYAFMADQIIAIDKFNPQVAARLAGCFDLRNKLTNKGRAKAHQQLERLMRSGLSSNTQEILRYPVPFLETAPLKKETSAPKIGLDNV